MTATRDGEHPINSPQWWEEYLRDHWDANGGAEQTRHFMQRLIHELPEPELQFLHQEVESILDWGCAHGEGVDELGRRFRGASVCGIDVAPSAIEEARRRFPDHEFVVAKGLRVPRTADVVISSNCLEHFDDPWAVAERLARAAHDLLILLVPCDEDPLCESHVVQFREVDPPERLGAMRRIESRRITVDPRHWAGDQLLVVYASLDYLGRRGLSSHDLVEREKWERHYGGKGLEIESDAMARFGEEFAQAVVELLPQGGRVLEAGAGAGWHSLALARTGRFDVTLMDFSENALRHARELFERERVAAEFVLGDARRHGEPEYDLVFNSGVLEHFSQQEQIAFVRAMASRSRDLVLALVPNSRCYWYWLWRVRAAVDGVWSFGREVPAEGLETVFEEAGLESLGSRVLGVDWTETFLEYLDGIQPELLRDLLTIHRSPIVDRDSKGYLLAGLGTVRDGGRRELPGWRAATSARPSEEAELAASLADSLALQIRMQQELIRLRGELRGAQLEASERLRVAEGLNRRIEELAASLENAARDHAGLETRIASLQQDVDSHRSAAESLRAELRSETDERQRHAAHAQRLEADLSGRRAEIDELSATQQRLSEEHRTLQEWQRVVEASKTFRLLRGLDRLRAKLRRR